jgi:hypothetical protein
MIEDPEVPDGDDAPLPRPAAPASGSGAASSSGRGAPAPEEPPVRVAFQIVPAAAAVPPQSNGWKVTVAGVLLLFFLASCAQLSLVANITKLPKASSMGCPWRPLPAGAGGSGTRDTAARHAAAPAALLPAAPHSRLRAAALP